MAYMTETVNGIEWEFYTLGKSDAKADKKHLETAGRFLHLGEHDEFFAKQIGDSLRKEQLAELRKTKPPRGFVGDAAVVTGVAGDISGDLVIPASLGGCKVMGIAHSAFYGCAGIKGVTIPDGVVSIDSNAFYNCRGLASITIPTSVTRIGAGAFKNCGKLASVAIPAGVTCLENGLFRGCNNLASIVIPASVKSIGVAAFKECKKLKSVTLPDGLKDKDIGRNAFPEGVKLVRATNADSKGGFENGNAKKGKATDNKKPSSKKKAETYSYTITFRGDGIDVNRVECKTQAELDACLDCARKWSSPGGDGVHGFIVDDDGVHVEVTDGEGNVAFYTDVKERDLAGKSGKVRIESKGNYFDESAKATKGKKFYYQSDDWYSGYQWKAELVLDAPFDPKKLLLVCQSYVNKNGREYKFIREECTQYGEDNIVKIAKSTEEEPTGGDDQVDAWTLVKGVRKELDYSDEE